MGKQKNKAGAFFNWMWTKFKGPPMPEPQGWMKAFGQKILPLRFKILFVIVLYVLLVLGIGIYINKYFPFMELDNYGLNKYNDNVAEILRNIIWTIGFLFGGFLAVLGFINSIHRTQQKDWELEAERYKTIADQTARNRQIDSEIFAKSVEHLGYEKTAIRLGGLYAIENLARSAKARPLDEDNKAYLNSLLETLAAYVREYAPIPKKEDRNEEDKVATDVEAAIRIICRTFDSELRLRIVSENIDIKHTYLPNLELPRFANLSQIDFSNSILTDVNFQETNLKRTVLADAILTRTDFSYASTDKLDISNADLSETIWSFSINRNQDDSRHAFRQLAVGIWDPDKPPHDGYHFRHRRNFQDKVQQENPLYDCINNRTIKIRKKGLWDEYICKQKQTRKP